MPELVDWSPWWIAREKRPRVGEGRNFFAFLECEEKEIGVTLVIDPLHSNKEARKIQPEERKSRALYTKRENNKKKRLTGANVGNTSQKRFSLSGGKNPKMSAAYWAQSGVTPSTAAGLLCGKKGAQVGE